MSAPVFRFAPSPNGDLHLGHALSAILNHELARKCGGRFLLRIEDIDPARSRERHVAQIYEDLAWLGLAWEQPVRRQSQHLDDYRRATARLEEMGLLYPCWASRSEIEAAWRRLGNPPLRDPDGALLYPGLWRDRPAAEIEARRAGGEPFALRLDMAKAMARLSVDAPGPLDFEAVSPTGGTTRIAVRPERWGDAVIVRKDTPTSYHLAVVVDDALQGVTEVVRGADLLAATDLHRVLQALLGLPVPRYRHHALVLGPDGQKLSKSRGDVALAALRRSGVTPEVVHRRLALQLQRELR